jgi:hypothetical protein
MTTLIEFYILGTDRIITSIDGDAVPRKGEHVNIAKVLYTVQMVNWCVDQSKSTSMHVRQLRACVELLPKRPTQLGEVMIQTRDGDA